MKKVFLPFCLSLIIGHVLAQSALTSSDVSIEIRNLLEAHIINGSNHNGKLNLVQYDLLLKFYTNRDFQEAWTQKGRLSENAQKLLGQIEEARFDGLTPEEYHLSEIKDFINEFSLKNENESSLHLAYIDLILSDAYLKLATDLYRGKVSQEALKTDWEIQPKRMKLKFEEELESALKSGKLTENLKGFWPVFKVYPRMRESLRAYHKMEQNDAIDWNKISGNKVLKVGEYGKVVADVRKRLWFWKDLKEYTPEEVELYDSAMMEGVLHFQKRNGLTADGVVGKDTYDALNETPAALIKKVAVNLERMRWLPDTVMDNRFVVVNIANFQLDLVQQNGLDTIFSSPVIVGRQYHTTPIFNGEMSYIVLSPTWTVPSSIIRNEMIPKIKKDPNYLNRNHLKILTYSGQEVNPSAIDWSKTSSKSFPYMIRQSPGPHNSLGLAKFIFPNKHNVYIHDTPSKSLFSKDIRAFSHGCIRVQNPERLAEVILEDNKDWGHKEIEAAMHSGRETTVMLKEKIPVVLLYLTFWTDESGNPHIRKDIYERDRRISEALFD
ncbi:L,D-transpeptidase family protein [Echinicola sp. CAU 1574]|uniref:L,D-transpeptidase family protein n=1 Tax=Echinicola arenosa TaxID=2774144 RepID=A0ABR9AGF5_9BACT|nr:L,D-transpeptidase family protein [Echinicola arenosa]MBD8487828.1 L,D-transpeptidase family protein [Echinicola arenosa]